MALLGLVSWGVETIFAVLRTLARMIARTGRADSPAGHILLETWQCHACGSSIRRLSTNGAQCPQCGEHLLRICLVGA